MTRILAAMVIEAGHLAVLSAHLVALRMVLWADDVLSNPGHSVRDDSI